MTFTIGTTARETARLNGVGDDMAGDATSRYCPGFNVWVVTVEGERYLVHGDDLGSVETRVYFAMLKRPENVEYVGPNPDAATWRAARA